MSGIQQYRRATITTANRMELVVMLYDGFLKYSRAAIVSIIEDNPAETGKTIGQAQAILHELSASLDHSVDPKLTEALESLYIFFEDRLRRAHMQKDPTPIEAVMPIMLDLRNAWATAATELAPTVLRNK